LINHSSDNSILPSDQSLRQYSNVSPNLRNVNLDETNSKNGNTSNFSNAYNASRSG
jgi:hypothetical protein